jgi:ABC-2 type transport system ATP-binding protein
MRNMEIIRIEGLEKSLGQFRLGPLDLRVEAGEILGVMGPNGAGKTTLLKLAWGFLKPDSGSVRIFGLQPHLDQIRLRLRSGYLSESPQFYVSLKVRTFLDFVSNFYEGWDTSRVVSLLAQFRIDPDMRIQNLSKGNRIKLGLISALGHRPSLLILDEPTSGLDPLVRIDILDFIRGLAREEKVCTVLSSHISDDLDQIADSVLMLNEGRVVEYSRTESLLQKYNLAQLEAVFLHAIGRVSQTRT